ncbi:MAG: pyruvate kinase [Thermofilaceae archaeon]|nr:pyruvate kinase [Thermofilaceae archaeon]MCX8179977.1 pyruvate kinase [Thermofilaceae archaeon]MDW8004718.1 pyruvate kinase [Thermofilaceae archaeon]
MGGLFVKIIASLGPASTDEDLVLQMAKCGADAFRTNFAHGDPEVWTRRLKAVRRAEEILNKPLAMIGDLKGPSVRVGDLPQPLTLKSGERVLVAPEYKPPSTQPLIPIPFLSLFETAKPGDEILIDDGRIQLRVLDWKGEALECEVLVDAVLEGRKNVSIRGRDLEAPLINERDLLALKFAALEGFDFVGLSHVRDASDVEEIKRILKSYGSDAWIISKIETLSALKNLDSIIEASDVILVARGDLGIRLNLEEVPYYQKLMVDKCLKAGKPVIVATQLLASMVENDTPTRAEVMDVSVAVTQGVDAVMLTNETSVGKYPLQAVRWLKRLITYTEEKMLREEMDRISTKARDRVYCSEESFARGLVELAESMGAKLVLYSLKGRTPMKVSSLRQGVPTFTGTPSSRVARKLAILWGVHAFITSAQDYDQGLLESFNKTLEAGNVKGGESVILGYGLREPEQKIVVKRVGPQCFSSG